MSRENEPVEGSGADGTPTPEDIAGQSTNSTDEPDYRSMYEELKGESQAKSAQLEAQLNQARAAADSRMASLENLVVQIANQGGAPAGPEPIDPDDPAAAIKYAERLVDAKLQQNNAQHEQRYRTLAGQALDSEKRRVDAENPDIVEHYGAEIDEYYRANPTEATRPGSYDDLVTWIKGKHFDEIAERKQVEYKKRASLGGIPSPTAPAPTGGTHQRQPDDAPILSEEEARLAEIYGRLEGGDPISAEEYLNVKTNRDGYPGRRPRGR